MRLATYPLFGHRKTRTLLTRTVTTTPASLSPDRGHALPRGEKIALIVLFGLAYVARIAEAFQFHYNSDESQHLHVAWAWTQGLVQYRDIFDNHTPLYHLLSAPLVWLIGNDPRILIDMRLIQLIPFTVILYLTYRIALPFFGKSIACWTTLFFAVFPAAFFRTLEYRPLALWLLLWLAVLLVLVGGRFTVKRAAVVGLLLGLNLLVSLKTILMLAALGLGVVLLPTVVPGLWAVYHPKRWWRPLGAMLLTAALPVACLVIAYAAMGALVGGPHTLIYCTVLHNIVPGQGTWSHPAMLLLLPLGLGLSVWLARWLYRREQAPVRRGEILFLLLVAGGYLSLLSVWPLVTNQTVVPVYPLMLILGIGIFFTDRPLAPNVGQDQAPSPGKDPLWLPIGIAVIELVIVITVAPVWRHNTAGEDRYVADVLKLTKPSTYVLDQKGETIFRRRPVRLVFETITRERLKLGLLKDNVIQRLIATRTPVVVNSQYRFPPKDQAFIRQNYLPVGPFYVLGQWLQRSSASKGGRLHIDIRIPARYEILPRAAGKGATIDGKAFSADKMLSQGGHVLILPPGTQRAALVWARAAQQGYKPLEHKP